MSNPIFCPVCGQSEPVEKVSTLYLTGLGLNEKTAAQRTGAGAQKLIRERSKSGPADLSRKLTPPSGNRQAFTRPVHPDQVVLALSIIIPVFLYGIFTSQQVFFLPALGVLAVFYALYFWQRKNLLARFEQEQASRRAADERVKTGIERWMRLYYCAVDEIVFEPGKDASIPVDQMPGHLLQEK